MTNIRLAPVLGSIIWLSLTRLQGYMVYDTFLPILLLFHVFWGLSLWFRVRRLLIYGTIIAVISFVIWMYGSLSRGIIWVDPISLALLLTIAVSCYRTRSSKQGKGSHYLDLPIFG